jgi:hypothetical protein
MNQPDFAARVAADLKKARQRRVKLVARLNKLDRELGQLEAAQALIDRYSTGTEIVAAEDDGASGSLMDLAVRLIGESDLPMSVPELADAVLSSDHGYMGDRDTLIKSLRGLVSRAHRRGLIEQVGRGRYARIQNLEDTEEFRAYLKN